MVHDRHPVLLVALPIALEIHGEDLAVVGQFTERDLTHAVGVPVTHRGREHPVTIGPEESRVLEPLYQIVALALGDPRGGPDFVQH